MLWSTTAAIQLLSSWLELFFYIFLWGWGEPVAKRFSSFLIPPQNIQTYLKLCLTRSPIRKYLNSCGRNSETCETTRTKKTGQSGYSNFIYHTKEKHADYRQLIAKARDEQKKRKAGDADGPMFSHVRKISPKALNIFGWCESIVMNDESPCIVEDPIRRKYSSLEGISRRLVNKYLYKVTYIDVY